MKKTYYFFQNAITSRKDYCFKLFLFLFLFSFLLFSSDNTNNNSLSDSDLINGFIKSKGYSHSIVFDASNIKQYLTDHSVISTDNTIHVLLKNDNSIYKSIPLKFQLSNVIETQDCRIDVIYKGSNFSFSVLDSVSKQISSSSSDSDFIDYHIATSLFHLEDTQDFSFQLVFSSEEIGQISISKIVLSFSNNQNSIFLGSPGFNELFRMIQTDGQSSDCSDVKYYISHEFNKIFIIIPRNIAESYRFLYHVYPVDKSDLLPDRQGKYLFNNYDFSLKRRDVVIPIPYFAAKDFVIIQRALPAYPCKKIVIGQYDSNVKPWTIEIKNHLVKE